ncbi:hypothetical protein BJV82DRAFT_672096 [Fennellomyces sp. T-0311]|nr:hypothetical protein BJV82DRAFT_672096 [Fennellomyces sp. T-0311]
MYITYDTKQYTVYDFRDGTVAPKPGIDPFFALRNQPESPFKPAWLVRVSDMRRVRGSDVHEPYCALSYSWNQSGEIVKHEGQENYTRADNGRHEIILHRKILGQSFRWIQHVKFEKIIQRICKDFMFRYIWFDQVCIDQSNEEEKKREIKRMHNIYRHAAYTVVLVPELKVCGVNTLGKPCTNINDILRAEWNKRVWTLEEAYMSQSLLFIGQNVHAMSVSASDSDPLPYADASGFLYTICSTALKWNASIALSLARKRTSTKSRDRFFALANMFPDTVNRISFSYSQPLTDLMLKFYECLAKNDPSILYFGRPLVPDTKEEKAITQRAENEQLPSWTGVAGAHALCLFNNDGIDDDSSRFSFDLTSIDYNVTGTSMRINCAYIPVLIEEEFDGQLKEMSDQQERAILFSDRILPVSTSECKALTFVVAREGDSQLDRYIQRYGLKASHFLPIKKNGEVFDNTASEPDYDGGWLSLTEESCSQCIILLGIAFKHPMFHFITHPVVMKVEEHYKAIGLCFIQEHFEYVDIDMTMRQTFVIR